MEWNGSERRSDRYGAVSLWNDKGGKNFTRELEGKYGKLIAKVLKTRKSDHLGDFARGIFPTTPTKGEMITLGEGTLFFEAQGDVDTVGLKPKDGRKSDWLDPKALYRVHQQTVKLYFEEIP